MTLRQITASLKSRCKAVWAPAVLLAGIALTGCTQDQHKFRSSEWEPKTLHIIETASQDVLWTYEIPVGYDLVLTLKDDGAPNSVVNPYTKGNPDVAHYALKSWENNSWGSTVESGRVDLPGNHVTLELEMRAAPEAYEPYANQAESDALATPEADAPLEAQAPVEGEAKLETQAATAQEAPTAE